LEEEEDDVLDMDGDERVLLLLLFVGSFIVGCMAEGDDKAEVTSP